jgi:transcriptional regulator with XRE-family HTH domain
MNLIGSRLKSWRQDAHVTQDNLCGQIAFITEGAWVPTRHDIYRIEAGTRTVSDAEVVALAAALGCRLVWLVCGTGAEPVMSDFAAQTFHGARPASEMLSETAE